MQPVWSAQPQWQLLMNSVSIVLLSWSTEEDLEETVVCVCEHLIKDTVYCHCIVIHIPLLYECFL